MNSGLKRSTTRDPRSAGDAGSSGLAKVGRTTQKLADNPHAAGPAPARTHVPAGRRGRRSLLRTRSVWRRRAGAAIPLLFAIAFALVISG